MTVLVTGGAGFIGSHIAEELLRLSHKVVVLDDLSGGFIENIPKDAEFIQGSITNSELVNRLFIEYKFEYVFHCAAYAAEILSHHIRRFNYENNVIGSINLINAAISYGLKCFVFLSSAAVYGDNQPPFHELLAPIPTDPYGIAKLTVELDLKAAQMLFELPHIIYRLHNVYGERQNISDKYRNVIGIFMNQLLQGKPLTIFGDGAQSRSFSYVRDIVPIIAKSIHQPQAYNEIFNLGSDSALSINELVSILAKVADVQPQYQYLNPRHEVKNVLVSHLKATASFGRIKETPIDIGLTEMFKWNKQHGSRPQKSFSNIEIIKMLPESWIHTDQFHED